MWLRCVAYGWMFILQHMDNKPPPHTTTPETPTADQDQASVLSKVALTGSKGLCNYSSSRRTFKPYKWCNAPHPLPHTPKERGCMTDKLHVTYLW